jgi:ketosteroid isomerase-like protein
MSPHDEVLAAEARRAAALVNADLDRLGALLAPELVYVHATGLRHDRGQLLEYLRDGPRFHKVCLEPQQVQVHNCVAIVCGLLSLRLQRPGQDAVDASSWVTQVWVKHADGWRLAAFQSTRPA